MAIVHLDKHSDSSGIEEAKNALASIPGILCVDRLYVSGTSTCTTRDTVIARFSHEIGKDERAVIASQATATIVKEFPGLEGWVLLRCLEPSRHDPFEVANALLANPRVLSAHPDFIHFVKKSGVPNDTYVNNQWALNKIDAPQGWDLHTGDENIVIAVLDDGVDTAHEDLSTKIVLPYDATDGDTNQEPNAWDGHGTACAGIAAALTNNGKGVAGISWKSKIMPIRIGYSQSASPGVMIVKDEWSAMGCTHGRPEGCGRPEQQLGRHDPDRDHHFGDPARPDVGPEWQGLHARVSDRQRRSAGGPVSGHTDRGDGRGRHGRERQSRDRRELGQQLRFGDRRGRAGRSTCGRPTSPARLPGTTRAQTAIPRATTTAPSAAPRPRCRTWPVSRR